MALSVSGFPEPSRHPGASNEVLAGENQDGYGKTTLMNSPRLRGLFGASSGPSKRPDYKNLPATSKPADTEEDSAISVTAPSSTSLAFHSSSFEPLSQQEYELELQLPMTIPPDSRGSTSKRAQLPPVPRKTTASPVRLGPNLTRLEISGAWARSPTLHQHPKSLPPSVVGQEWGAKGPDITFSSSVTLHQPRPLPSVPGITADPGKHIPNAVAGPSRLASPVPVVGSSRNVNAVAGPSRHVNAVAGPSKHANAIAGPSKHDTSLSSSLSPATPIPPTSKVLIPQSPKRTHSQNSHSLSMRYRPLVADLASTQSIELGVNTPHSAPASGSVRPLPRIPPLCETTTTTPVTPSAAPLPSSSQCDSDPPTGKAKRPKTSPGPIPGFLPPASATLTRSPFDNITGAWGTRSADLMAQRAHSPPLPINSGPRARSHSRTRRDRSLDSHRPNSSLRRTLQPSMPVHGKPSTAARPLRSLPSPIVGGGRPLPAKAMTLDYIPSSSKALQIQTSSAVLTLGSGSSRVLSPGRRSQVPLPPTGPVKPRGNLSPKSSPVIAPLPVLRIIPTSEPAVQYLTAAVSATQDETITLRSSEDSLHLHPLEAFTDTDSFLQTPVSPIAPESPIEVFVDDKDLSTISRSPSPIRYARPDSRGHLSDLVEDDIPSSSSSASSRASSQTRRRRTQLRSYRNSYRAPPHTYQSQSPSPVLPEFMPLPLALAEHPESDLKLKKKKARSYFGGTPSGSNPDTRTPSPERKSRSRQPRKLAEAVTLALGGRGGSSSPKRKTKPSGAVLAPGPVASYSPAVAKNDMEVLDISLPTLSRRETGETASSSDIASPSVGGARGGSTELGSSAIAGWVKTLGKKRSELGGYSSSGSGSLAYLGTTVTAVEFEEVETPYMWVSTGKPSSPAPFIPSPPPLPHHHHHRPMDSGLEDYVLPIGGSRPQTDSSDFEKHGASYVSAIGGGKPWGTETTVTSTVSVSRPPSSSISTPFSAFSLTKGRKKRAASFATPGISITDDSSSGLVERDVSPKSTEEVAWTDVLRESRDEADGGEVVVVTTRRVVRGVDQSGDTWERDEETGLVDIIPHLRSLKVSKS